ncbi:MAG: 3-dehydroquinate synthase [Alphaproteobacteria bacterium]|nr:3-dehydroquinate synthase [Alphaproteobacteria bacterium]MBV9371373.1 3-dehydroquinate synthase [Alphaproteobacteria bacterium]MBV9901837.1 3-dehydroquinate synthase [Alphaproteobacteria bacterium]
MSRVDVKLGERAYTIRIERGLLEQAGETLAPFARGGRLIVVSDENVWAAHGARLAGPFRVEAAIVPPGEASKSWAELERLVERMLALGVERGDHIVAFGGGMVGDLAGFAAAIVKRGCGYVQVPTTLLAQVDSSVGGKTAINAGAGKNLVGAFHQPAAVFIDPLVLETLPPRELRAGYAEAVKYGLIADPAFFAWCEANGAALLGDDVEARLHAIETCVRMKAAIVGEDERETKGRRALLNLGHTFGHAIEAETGFAMLHGEAVALGMTLAFRFSAARGLCAPGDARRVEAHLAAAGLPTRLAVGTPERLVGHMAADKKASGGRVPFILARGIGGAFVDESVALAEVAAFLAGELAP